MDFTPVRGELAASRSTGSRFSRPRCCCSIATRTIVYANPAAENLFELSARHLVGHSPAQVFAGRRTGSTPRSTRRSAAGAAYTEQELELGVAAKPRLHLTCTVSPVDDHAALLLEFRHIDQQLKIAREERLLEQQQANRELIRSLAHEIKNPLGGHPRRRPAPRTRTRPAAA